MRIGLWNTAVFGINKHPSIQRLNQEIESYNVTLDKQKKMNRSVLLTSISHNRQEKIVMTFEHEISNIFQYFFLCNYFQKVLFFYLTI